jgi:hypothetical protein
VNCTCSITDLRLNHGARDLPVEAPCSRQLLGGERPFDFPSVEFHPDDRAPDVGRGGVARFVVAGSCIRRWRVFDWRTSRALALALLVMMMVRMSGHGQLLFV